MARPAQRSSVLATGTTIDPCKAPATLKQGKAELGACLTLVSPSGLTAEDRAEWLAVAMRTLSGIPADLLAAGCAVARRKCRFPSEIVPTIMEEIETRWKWRREDRGRISSSIAQLRTPQPDDEPLDLVDPAEVRKLVESLSVGTGA